MEEIQEQIRIQAMRMALRAARGAASSVRSTTFNIFKCSLCGEIHISTDDYASDDHRHECSTRGMKGSFIKVGEQDLWMHDEFSKQVDELKQYIDDFYNYSWHKKFGVKENGTN